MSELGEEGIQAGIESIAAMFGLDDFQKIALADLLRDLDGKFGPETEDKLIQLGALVSNGRTLEEFAEEMRKRGENE